MKQMFDATEISNSITHFLPYVHTFCEVSSTNDLLKQAAGEGAPEGTIFIAERQTSGRGRLNRNFVSNKGGIYMSILIRPQFSAAELPLLTPIAAVAVTEAVQTVCGINSQIKWVNDICIDGKKFCGILCESVFSPNGVSTIVGIGINIGKSIDGLPSPLAATVTALPHTCNPAVLAATVADRFFYYYKDFGSKEYIRGYIDRCFVVGKEVTVIKNGQSRPAFANSLTDTLGLNVTYHDGSTETLTVGEVSLKI